MKKALIVAIICFLFPLNACNAQDTSKVNLDIACQNCTINNQTTYSGKYSKNSNVDLTVVAINQALLPDEITVIANNKILIKNQDYHYSSDTGKFTYTIKDDTAVDIKASLYNKTIEIKCTKCRIDGQETFTHSYPVGKNVSVKITPDEGYNLPENVNATTKDGKILEKGIDYYYFKNIGTFTYSVNDDIIVNVVATIIQKKLSATWLNCTIFEGGKPISAESQYPYGSNIKLKIVPDKDCFLPEDVKVTSSSKTLIKGVDYNYSKDTGEFSYTFKEDINLEVKATKQFNFSVICSNCSIDGKREIHGKLHEGEMLEYIIVADEKYTLPEDIRVTLGGRTLIKGEDYNYSKDTGKFSYAQQNGETKISIYADSIAPMVDAICKRVNINGKKRYQQTYSAGDEVKITFSPDEFYALPNDVSAHTKTKTLVKNVDYNYNSATGEMTFIFQETTIINIEGKVSTATTTLLEEKATIEFTFDCPSYTIDWGDGYQSAIKKHTYEPETSTAYHINITPLYDEKISNLRVNEGQENLAFFSLHSEITSIADAAFSGCKNLKKFCLPLTDSPISAGNAIFDNCSSDLKIAIPTPELLAKYKNARNWSQYASQMVLDED